MKLTRIFVVTAAFVGVPASVFAQAGSTASAQRSMPHVAVHDPVFVAASNAPFALEEDLVIGVAQGTTVKAYLAADLRSTGLWTTGCRTARSR